MKFFRPSLGAANCTRARCPLNRWAERYPLVVDHLHTLQADVIALQEVRINIGQHILLRDALNNLTETEYDAHLCEDWYNPPILANAFLTRIPVIEHERIELPEGFRTAHRILIDIDGTRINIANTHLHHKPLLDECIRLPQLRAIRTWLGTQQDTSILMGDLNAQPQSETIQEAQNWLSSAYHFIHGKEPDQTFPTPLRQSEDLIARTIDYILVDESVIAVHDAGVLGNLPHPNDETLYASDHFGLWADVRIK